MPPPPCTRAWFPVRTSCSLFACGSGGATLVERVTISRKLHSARLDESALFPPQTRADPVAH